MISVRSLSMMVALAALAAAGPAQAASINLGGNGGLLGTGLLGGGGNSAGGNGSVNVTVGSGGLLGGSGSDSTAANVTLGSGDGGTGNVLVDLFGNGGQSGDAGLSLGVGLGVDQGGGTSIAPTNGNVTLDLFGDGTDSASGGGLGSGGGGPGGGPSPTTTGLFGPGATTVTSTTASLGTGMAKSCFTPNPRQVMQLVNRHAYVPATFQSWAGAVTIKVVDAGVCDAAAARIDAQDNIGRLQAYISSDPQLRSQIEQWGHAPSDVIAVDRQGQTLIVYVS